MEVKTQFTLATFPFNLLKCFICLNFEKYVGYLWQFNIISFTHIYQPSFSHRMRNFSFGSIALLPAHDHPRR